MERWTDSFGGFKVVQYHGDAYTRMQAKVCINERKCKCYYSQHFVRLKFFLKEQ